MPTQPQPHPDTHPLDPIRRWFATRGRVPFEFQEAAWARYLRGESGLIHAPTGVGKTLAAWLGPVAEALAEPRSTATPGLKVLWVTPLRALAADTVEALAEPLGELGLMWEVEARTGDTPAAARARQARSTPAGIVTTPESLSLMLSYPDWMARLTGLRCVVVDEWHELMGSKRGVQTELALARLKRRSPGLRVWGLSATIGNTGEAMATLLGDDAGRGRLVPAELPKEIRVEAVIPTHVERFPWAGHLGVRLLPQVLAAIEAARSSLVFTNTRSQAETWFQAIQVARPEWNGAVALHHGSIDRAERAEVERRLRAGDLKAVVCTSSLDLGVDFTPVDQVLQIGSPKGIARLMQRAGRSGHGPGRTSRVLCVPTHALELIEIAAARAALSAGALEPRVPVRLALDVLVQHLVTVGLGEPFAPEELLAEVRSTHAYRELPDAAFAWALGFASQGGPALKAYPEYARLALRNGRWSASGIPAARRHRMSIGTITSDAAVAVRYLNGVRIGTVEESFAARLRPGEVFVFAGKRLRFFRLRDMTIWVRRATTGRGVIPQWMGSRMPLSTRLAAAVRRQLELGGRGRFEHPEMDAVRPLLDLQARWSAIPDPDELLVEHLQSREGRHLFVYPFQGRMVHEGLAALMAYRACRDRPLSVSTSVNDYGLELLSDQPLPSAAADIARLLSPDDLLTDILQSLNVSEMARRQFRDIARIAGLVFPGYPGSRKSDRQVQASSGLIYTVFARYDPGNLLLEQAVREVLENQLEHRRLEACLRAIAAGTIRVTEPGEPTPLAFPILVSRMRAQVSSETLAARVRRMQVRLDSVADRPTPRRRRRAEAR
jgi:ATP-dependent Lhr-like helicase